MTLSQRWADRHHRALGSTTDDAVRLAIALGAVRSIIRVVDRSQPAMTVDWAAYDPNAEKGVSYTDFQGGQIRINPAPILNPGTDHGEALDVVTGFALHEASHSQESRDRYRYLVKQAPHPNGRSMREVPAFEPMRIAAYLWNLVEDVRIEAATTRSWPGFGPYFDKVVDYLWAETKGKVAEDGLPNESDVASRLRLVFIACRFGIAAVEPWLIGEVGDAVRDEMTWWRGWQDDYLTERVDTATTIQRGLDRLAQDPETAEEMGRMAADDKREREAGEKLAAQIERLVREGVEGAFEMCQIEQGEVMPLDAETAERVKQYIREGLVEVRTVVTHAGATIPPVHARKPTETYASKRAYVGRPNAESEALRAALVFRQAAPEYREKLLSEGEVDDEELWRWAAGDMRVYGNRVIESKPDVFMGLLIDASGSMYGEKLTIAQRLAQLFVWAVHDQEGITTQVWAHTADMGGDRSCEVFRLWELGDPLSRLGLIETLDHVNNADGVAIEYVATQIAAHEQPEKVLLVLSDGLPSAHGYGGKPARQHIRSVVRWAEQRGVHVHQIAIDPNGLRPQEQSAMFGEGNWTGFTSYAALPRQIARMLARYV